VPAALQLGEDLDGFLLRRRTYEIFAAHWPTAPEEEQVLAQPSLQSGFPYDLDLRRIASAERSQARRLFFDLLSNTPR
jgi:hypothetical protein